MDVEFTPDQEAAIKEDFRLMRTSLDETRRLLTLHRKPADPEPELHAPPPSDRDAIDAWLRSGSWTALRRLAVVAALLIVMGCGSAQKATGPCVWRAKAVAVVRPLNTFPISVISM